MGINSVHFHGNVTRDPDFRTVSNGKGGEVSLVTFTLASSRKFVRADKSSGEETTFVDFELFGNRADVILKYVHKGDPLLVKGSLKLDSWKNKEGENRSRLLVKVEDFDLLWKKVNGSVTTQEENVAVYAGDDLGF